MSRGPLARTLPQVDLAVEPRPTYASTNVGPSPLRVDVRVRQAQLAAEAVRTLEGVRALSGDTSSSAAAPDDGAAPGSLGDSRVAAIASVGSPGYFPPTLASRLVGSVVLCAMGLGLPSSLPNAVALVLGIAACTAFLPTFEDVKQQRAEREAAL